MRARETRAARVLSWRILIIIVTLLLCPVISHEAFAQSAKEQLEETVNRVMELLRTIESREDIVKSKPLFRQILAQRFDFAAMARSSLGDRWDELNEREDEFVLAFTNVLESVYMGTLGSYQGEAIIYNAERVNRELAEVDTRVVGGRGEPIKLGYKLHLNRGTWKVIEIILDDVSLVSNYRSQFRRVLRTYSLQDLIGKLRAIGTEP
jgi:phospholipid transport system substrate-binding protein